MGCRALPRPDKGDREEYCRTMLVLFHPRGWRSGLDLKTPDQTWSDAFAAVTFSSGTLQIMKNMNVLYECHDARDDYAAQRRTDGVACGVDGTGQQSSDSVPFVDPEWEFTEQSLIDSLEDGAIGPRTARNRKEMNAMIAILPLNGTISSAIVTAARMEAIAELTTPRSERVVSSASAPSRGSSDSMYQPIVASKTLAQLRKMDPTFNPSPSTLQDSHLQLLHASITSLSLNSEQSRAFRLIATHLHHHERKPLRMYLGGSSAALIGGSTYHSALGIQVSSEHASPTLTSVEKLRGKIQRVDLIFIDELSMISCGDVYKINAQLAKACPDSGETFGGKSVVLAGDFAQLPPAGPSPCLYSNAVGAWSSSASSTSQKSAMGKALWHEFVTVVILRVNMRQQDPSRESDVIDDRLQQVLWDLHPNDTGHHAGTLSLCEENPRHEEINLPAPSELVQRIGIPPGPGPNVVTC
ncbi:hypothetical protein VTO73DRAFT_3521 [Trametes versicolor]